MMRGRWQAVGLVALAALVLGPLSRQIQVERERLQFGGFALNREVRDQVGQGMAIALLAGFRGLVADLVWIRSHEHWEKKQWLQQYNNMQLATILQPRSVLFWDIGAWHMAWNIGYAERVDTNNVTQAQGIKRERVWFERARDYLERGIENLPHRHELYFRLGWLYQQKFNDPCRAALAYDQAARFPDAPAHIARLRARIVEQCGDTKRAYAYWRELWQQPAATNSLVRPIIERELRRLENKLELPLEQRIFSDMPDPAQ